MDNIITRGYIEKIYSRNSNLSFKTMTNEELQKFLLKAKLIGYIVEKQNTDTYTVYMNNTFIVASTNKFAIENGKRLFQDIQLNMLDLSEVDTTKATTFEDMFLLSNMHTLNLSNWKNTNITNMSDMFKYARIKMLNLENFNTKKVNNMYGMFEDSKIEILDLSSFDVNNVKDMGMMLYACKTKYIDLSSFILANDCYIETMFGCGKATIKLPKDKKTSYRLKRAAIQCPVEYI